MAAQLAIDYGADRLRLLEYEGSGRKLRVLAVTEIPLEVAVAAEGDEVDAEAERARVVVEALKRAGVVTDPSAMAFDAGHALFREFDLPFTNAEQIEKVVRFEAESHIPLDIDDVVVQHLVLRQTRDKSHILAAAVRKDDLLDRLDVLDEAGIDPMFVDIDVFALYHALVGTGLAEAEGIQVVLNVQERATSVLFLSDGRLFAVRSLRLGTHGIHGEDDAGASSLDREIDTARAHDFLSRLKRELRRTLTTLPGLGAIGAVAVTGSGCRVPGLDAALQEVFEQAPRQLDLLEHVDHKLAPEDAARHGLDAAVALGMAFKLNGLDETRTEFRREECAYTRKFDQVKSPLIVLAFLLFLIVALGAIDALFQAKRVQAEYASLLNDAGQQLAELLDSKEAAEQVYSRKEFGPAQMQAISTEVDKLHDELSRQLGRSQSIPVQASALAAWIEFANMVSEHEAELGRLWVHRLDISVSEKTPTLKVTGVMEDNQHYNRLLDLFEEDPLYLSPKTGKTTFNDAGQLEFSETVVELDLDELLARRQG